jgi:hypothetical protein
VCCWPEDGFAPARRQGAGAAGRTTLIGIVHALACAAGRPVLVCAADMADDLAAAEALLAEPIG